MVSSMEKLNRKYEINKEHLAALLNYLGKDKMVGRDDWHYGKAKDKPITEDQYYELFQALEQYAEAKDAIHDVTDSCFPEEHAYFIFNEIRFTWRLLIGQGSAVQIVAEQGWPAKVPFKVRKAIKIK